MLGFALGGFFDGILLHQILQWHHLLSLVPGLADLRLQVLWDGYFHALMYLVAVLGLWGLWRAGRGAASTAGRGLAAALLVGFGLWHVVDGVLSHWVLGIHRIKLDSEAPLLWDLLWLVAFGLAPMAAGWLLARGDGGAPGRAAPTIALLLLTAGTAGAGAWSLRPPPGQPFTTVVFRPGLAPGQAIAALAAADARLVWADPSLGVVVVAVDPGRRWRLYAQGALLVSGSGVPAGCLDWSRV
ncbi:hypothetical protein STVA_33210 [Allostella vacuolata]|nr:hypothetical protein STVA_33210 [Stella vacuolata]